ncbi:mannose-6-phosphate isomerase, class I [Salinibacterium hongtaonis]|uniref:mannose-6-phosphate isomerase, class I n=1 Tax=Homoserinimonas hongtaonis TaxID=2079791 RepID=UPI001F540504|nr:mannose-6-phosphate isomerase, class I [Salinibacterium hongtaonis]
MRVPLLLPITNEPRPYAWGSRSAIAQLRGVAPSAEPQAELWLGTHPGSPARLVDAPVEGVATLADWVEREQPSGSTGLPYLLKLLAADAPLSLQAHPTTEQASEGFERENAAGIPLDAPERNYRDPFAKPEVILALSDTFDALCGFRDAADAEAAIAALAGSDPVIAQFAARVGRERTASIVEWLITRGPGVDDLVERVTRAAESADGIDADTVRLLAAHHPGDPGIVTALLLNRVTLSRGEALFLPAGNIHAYLRGFGVELMTASDNVLRGGLTLKHVDPRELLSVLRFDAVEVPRIQPREATHGVRVFRPEGVGFELSQVSPASETAIVPQSIVLCTAGRATVVSDDQLVVLAPGEALYVTADDSGARVETDAAGEAFIASPA